MLEDCGGSLTSSKPAVSSSSVGSSHTAVPSLTLTSDSTSKLSLQPPLSVLPVTSDSSPPHHLLQATFNHHHCLSTTNMTSPAGPSTSAGRRMSLGTLRVNSSQQRQASSSSLLFVDGTGVTARPSDNDIPRRSVTSVRSPRVRRKSGRGTTAGKTRDKRSVKLSKVPKPPVVDDWLKFDLSSVTSAGAASAADVDAGDDASADEDGVGSLAAAASFVDITDTVSQRVENSELYAELAQMTRSVGRFSKLAYPDMHGHVVTPFREAFYEKRFGTQRSVSFLLE